MAVFTIVLNIFTSLLGFGMFLLPQSVFILGIPIAIFSILFIGFLMGISVFFIGFSINIVKKSRYHEKFLDREGRGRKSSERLSAENCKENAEIIPRKFIEQSCNKDESLPKKERLEKNRSGKTAGAPNYIKEMSRPLSMLYNVLMVFTMTSICMLLLSSSLSSLIIIIANFSAKFPIFKKFLNLKLHKIYIFGVFGFFIFLLGFASNKFKKKFATFSVFAVIAFILVFVASYIFKLFCMNKPLNYDSHDKGRRYSVFHGLSPILFSFFGHHIAVNEFTNAAILETGDILKVSISLAISSVIFMSFLSILGFNLIKNASITGKEFQTNMLTSLLNKNSYLNQLYRANGYSFFHLIYNLFSLLMLLIIIYNVNIIFEIIILNFKEFFSNFVSEKNKKKIFKYNLIYKFILKLFVKLVCLTNVDISLLFDTVSIFTISSMSYLIPSLMAFSIYRNNNTNVTNRKGLVLSSSILFAIYFVSLMFYFAISILK